MEMKRILIAVACALLCFPVGTAFASGDLNQKMMGFYRWADSVVVDATLTGTKVTVIVKDSWNVDVPEAYGHAIMSYAICKYFEDEHRKSEGFGVEVHVVDSRGGLLRVGASGSIPGGRYCTTVDQSIEN